MSGIVAVAGRGKADRELLAALVADLAGRGPDGQGLRVQGPVGLGHTLLAIGGAGGAGVHPLQPLSLDGRTWIVADARLDGRGELVGRLEADGAGDAPGAVAADQERRTPAGAPVSDAELILRSYDLWGADLVEHLLGDFAFLLWDGVRRRLVCARDHLGVKPVYWAFRDGLLLVSNAAAPLRRHPAVGDDVDEAVVADYLLFGFNHRSRRTGLARVHKLPPAHLLIWEPQGEPAVRRYWSLPAGRQLSLSSDGEYVHRFLDLLGTAVRDRMPEEPAAILMSGGLDSTSVAAMAAEMGPSSHAAGLAAITFVYEDVTADRERHYSRVAADALGIPIHHIELDDDTVADLWSRDAPLPPEPVEASPTRRVMRHLAEAVPGVRVGLTGQGGDPGTHLSPADFWHQLGGRRALRTGIEVGRWWWRRGRLPAVGLRTGLKRWLQPVGSRLDPVYPPWLAPELESRLELRGRWRRVGADRRGPESALRPRAHGDLGSPVWPALMERYDPGFTGVAAEVRHPYLDLRLVEYLLAVPPVPWCVEKELVRVAMRGRLPEAVRTRRKAPLPLFPAHARLQQGLEDVLRVVRDTRGLGRFIDVDRFLTIAANRSRLRASEHYLVTRPLGLARWLHELDHPRSAG